MNSAIRSLGAVAPTVADQAADSANQAIRSTQGVANAAFDRLSDSVDQLRDRAAPAIERLASQAEAARRRSVEAMQQTAAQLRDSAHRAQDNAIGYVRDEPMKALLIAAATGAALMAILGLLSRSRRVD